MIQRVLPAILIFGAIGIFALYIVPTYNNNIVPLRGEIARNNSALAAADNFKKSETEIAQKRAAIPEESIDKLKKFMPDGVDNVQLILDLNSLASRSGITLSNFNIKQNSTPVADTAGTLGNGVGASHGLESLDLTVTATGNYTSFRTFLSGVEHSLRPMDVTQVIISDSPTGVYSYDMTFRIYWLH